jgi:hypothetical protein
MDGSGWSQDWIWGKGWEGMEGVISIFFYFILLA